MDECVFRTKMTEMHDRITTILMRAQKYHGIGVLIAGGSILNPGSAQFGKKLLMKTNEIGFP